MEDVDISQNDNVEIEELHGEEYEEHYDFKNESFGDKLFSKYMKLFEKLSMRNEVYAHLVYHFLLGQLSKHIKIYVSPENWFDCRSHTLYIAPSGSGKSTGSPLIADCSKELGEKFEKQSGPMTDAALVGGYEIEVNPMTGERRTIEIKGVMKRLEDRGYFFHDEASVFFSSPKVENSQNVISATTSMMNPIGRSDHVVTRSLKHGTITLHPQYSLCAVTYPVKDLLINTLRGGSLQRMTVYYRKMSRDDWIKSGTKIGDSMFESQFSEQEIWDKVKKENKDLFDSIIKDFKEVKEFAKNIDRLKWVEGMKLEIENFVLELDKLIGQLSGDSREIFDSFRNRSLGEAAKFATHRALADKRDYVKVSDYKYGEVLVLESLKSLIEMVESTEEMARRQESSMIRWEKMNKNWHDLYKQFHIENGKIVSTSFIRVLAQFFDVSEPTSYRDLEVWIRKGLITRDSKYILR